MAFFIRLINSDKTNITTKQTKNKNKNMQKRRIERPAGKQMTSRLLSGDYYSNLLEPISILTHLQLL